MKLGYTSRNCKRRKFKPTEHLRSVLLFQGKLIIYRKDLEEISARAKTTIKKSAEKNHSIGVNYLSEKSAEYRPNSKFEEDLNKKYCTF